MKYSAQSLYWTIYEERKLVFCVYNKLTLNDKNSITKDKMYLKKLTLYALKTKFQGNSKKIPVGQCPISIDLRGSFSRQFNSCDLVLTTLFSPQQGFTSSSKKKYQAVMNFSKYTEACILQVLYIYNDINAEFKARFMKKHLKKIYIMLHIYINGLI